MRESCLGLHKSPGKGWGDGPRSPVKGGYRQKAANPPKGAGNAQLRGFYSTATVRGAVGGGNGAGGGFSPPCGALAAALTALEEASRKGDRGAVRSVLKELLANPLLYS